ncbi:MAG: 7-carboxy-7-deazaguanine synthase QueE [Planctomycetota bacterium]
MTSIGLNLLNESMLVSETFVSVQGEGKLTGVPSWFVRASGCNLRCTWCDTPYASWNPEGVKRSVRELLDEARSAGVRHAVLTGGEPMLFDQLATLSRALRDAGLHITWETAGTVFRDAGDIACDLLSISPKLANSTPSGDPRDPDGVWAARHERARLSIDTLNGLLDAHTGRQCKFVVRSPSDLPEIESLLVQMPGLEPSDVMLMPEGVRNPEPESVRWAVDACLARGWRYCHRLQIELFGDTRGT